MRSLVSGQKKSAAVKMGDIRACLRERHRSTHSDPYPGWLAGAGRKGVLPVWSNTHPSTSSLNSLRATWTWLSWRVQRDSIMPKKEAQRYGRGTTNVAAIMNRFLMLAFALCLSHSMSLTSRSRDDEAHALHVERVAWRRRFHVARRGDRMFGQPGGCRHRVLRPQRDAVDAIAL